MPREGRGGGEEEYPICIGYRYVLLYLWCFIGLRCGILFHFLKIYANTFDSTFPFFQFISIRRFVSSSLNLVLNK